MQSLNWFYFQKKLYSNAIVIPMLNIVHSDFSMRTESVFTLNKNGICAERLTFRDQLDLASIQNEGKLKLTLVDFNILPGKDAELEISVVEVLDHHQRERDEKERYTPFYSY